MINTIAVKKSVHSSLYKSVWGNGVNADDTLSILNTNEETGSLTFPSALQGFNSNWTTYAEDEDIESSDNIVDTSWRSLWSEYEGDEVIESVESTDNFVDSSWCSLSSEYIIQNGMNKKACIWLSIGDNGSEKEVHYEDSHFVDFSEILLAEDTMPCLSGKDDHNCEDCSEDFESLCNDSIKIAKQRKFRARKNGI
jgi:hypothetical protein